jgi:hypothetical protein
LARRERVCHPHRQGKQSDTQDDEEEQWDSFGEASYPSVYSRIVFLRHGISISTNLGAITADCWRNTVIITHNRARKS